MLNQPVLVRCGRRQVVAAQLVVGPLRTRYLGPARARVQLPCRLVVVEPIAVERVTASQAFSHAGAQCSASRLEYYGAIVSDPESSERIEFAGITPTQVVAVPSVVANVAAIVVMPGLTAVTSPVESTTAMEESALDHSKTTPLRGHHLDP